MPRNEFDAIRQRFPNDEAILNFLRSVEGFENVGRATLSRWAGVKTRLPKRGILAATILNQIRGIQQPRKKAEVCRIQIFHHRTELAVPAQVAYTTFFPKACATRLNIRVELSHSDETTDGKNALDQLAKSPSGLAFADRSVVNDFHLDNSCLPVCAIANSFPLIVATKRIKRMAALSGVRFYCPENTSLGGNIRSALRRRGISPNKRIIIELPKKPSLRRLSTKETHCFVGWSDWISDIRDQVSTVNVKSTTLGLRPISYTLFAKPGALTFNILCQFLLNLDFVNKNESIYRGDATGKYLGENMSVEDFLKSLKDREVRFKLGKLETSTILRFFELETSSTGSVK